MILKSISAAGRETYVQKNQKQMRKYKREILFSSNVTKKDLYGYMLLEK